MKFCLLMCVAGLFTAANLRATTIEYEVGSLGTNSAGETVDQITYLVSGLTLQSTQELDLYFSPTIYNSIFNPATTSAYWTELGQPNDPPGAAGYFGVDANLDNTVVGSPFSIDVALAGGAALGPQQYSVSQFDAAGNFIGIVASESGVTTPVAAAANAPEPASFALVGLAVALLGIGSARRVKFGKASSSK